MIYQLTIKHADGSTERRTAIGKLAAIVDALYDAGALGVTAMVRK
jgi:predicted fused transcriptional regulator/phosphomethylpyrimidine kinase